MSEAPSEEEISVNKRYLVRLSEDERGHLEELLVCRGKAHTRRLLCTRILLKADAAQRQGQIGRAHV